MTDSPPEGIELFISMAASSHQPASGLQGCTCGFLLWSVGHVALVSFREGWAMMLEHRAAPG